MRRTLVLLIVFALATISPLAQVQTQVQPGSPRMDFDVAAIRPSDPNLRNGWINATPGGRGYTARNVPVKLMISLMYKVPMRQIKGGPPWMDSDRFDIEAKTDHAYNLDDLHTMYQNLLADRFSLRFHKETKEGPVYALTIDPSGLKMKANTAPQEFKVPINGPPDHVVGVRVPMNYLCWWLGQVLQNDERPVVNMTGLDGNYDFTVAFMPVLPPGASADNLPENFRDLPSIFTALREQLGLKLQPQKGPVEYYIIDHVEKPSAN